MTHDLLQLAEDLSDASTRQSNGFYTPDLPSLGFSAAAALRAAHEEREYFNRFRDELQAANTKLTLENRELRALVKRHEDALGNIRMILADKSISDTGCVLAIESAMKEVGR